MLKLDEQDLVRDVLSAALDQNGDARGYVTATFSPRHAEILRDMPTNFTRNKQYAVHVLTVCLDSRWPAPPTRSLLEVLLAALVTEGHDDGMGTLAKIRDRVKQGEAADPNPDPSKALWVRDRLPFFSRDALRPVVKQLLADDAQPILKIIGPEDSGKSYTRFLIDHVCTTSRRDLHLVVAEVAEGAGPTYNVEQLADTLVAPMPTSALRSRPQRSTSDYPASLCLWILNSALQSEGRWVFVLDGFHQQFLQDETKALVQALAAQIAGPGEYRRRIRLVLIDYPSRLPRVHAGTILDEQVPSANAVTADHVAACLQAHYEDLRERGRPKNPTSVKDTATALLADATTNGGPSLEVLNDMLTRLRGADLRA